MGENVAVMRGHEARSAGDFQIIGKGKGSVVPQKEHDSVKNLT